jgi:hypothetical protein
MKFETKRVEYRWTSRWSNHPDGQNVSSWGETGAPNQKYFSESFGAYLPDDAETQKPSKSGYFRYPDGTRVKSEYWGDNPANPCGMRGMKITMIFP